MFSTKLSSKPALNTFGCGLLLSLKTKQRNPWNKHLKGKEYVCSRAFSVQDSRKIWRSSCFYRWRHLISIYPQACKFLNMDHHIHSQFEKSIVERTIQYIKDRTECFDDYFPCRKKKCKLKHLINWLNLFKDFHNKELCLK